MNLQRLLASFSLLLSIFVSTQAFAADRWFQIEMIIFGQNHSATTVREPIPDNTFIPDSLTAVKLSPEGVSHLKRGSSVAFRMLSSNNFVLKSLYNKLSTRPSYTPIMHVAWRQPVAYRKKGFKVKIEGGRVFVVQPGNNGSEQEITPVPTSNKPLYEISGIVTVTKKTYFHLSTDILYRHKDTAAGNLKVYRMKGSRRMKSNELHYIDHPMFGLIIKIRKI